MEKSYFFNSVGGDRKYDSSSFAEYFSSVLTNGIHPTPSTSLQVTADNTYNIQVEAGRAFINGYLYANTLPKTLPIEIADGVLKRKDLVVIRLNMNNREITAEVIQGTPSENPIAPEVTRTAVIYELALAEVTINAAAPYITQANVLDTRMDSSRAGWINSLIQADTESIFNNYQNWYNTKTGEYETDWQEWFEAMKDQVANDDHTLMNSRLDALETNKADLDHTHDIAEFPSLQDALDKKLTIGDFGIGGNSINIYGQNIDLLDKTGFYHSHALTGIPEGAHHNGYVIHIEARDDLDYAMQFYYTTTGNEGYWSRRKVNGTWEDWKKVLHRGDYGLGGRSVDVTNSNLDDLRTKGTQFISGYGMINAPSSYTYYGWHIDHSSHGGAAQIIYGADGLYQRQYTSGAWTPWEKNSTKKTYETTIAINGIYKIVAPIDSNIQVMVLGSDGFWYPDGTRIQRKFQPSTGEWVFIGDSAQAWDVMIIING
ncbi:hypothetical protein SAMN05192533_102264 [Mesobacillus persicus]|uniref:Uncharacterized protein n=1 Tax=Mesobacillus persicus TaxID=930146 RepID=A0A1H7XLF9_9BACI|nr:pyocin knob domain-containing protein [Mesobacillus persicus]SEM34620.1 hypothetical protein SAMN05192533_102264 [Mesobacillus persicus]